MEIIEGFKLRDVMGHPTVVGEGVAQVNFNKIISLNASAAYLWGEVAGRSFTCEDLASLLVSRYGIERKQAERDAAEIADEWVKHGLAKP